MEKKPLLTNQNVEGEPGAYPVYGALEKGYRPPPYAPTYPQKGGIEEKYKSLYYFLKSLDIENCLDTFRQEEVTLDILPEISDSDLRDMKIPLGVRKKLSKHLKIKSSEEKIIKSNGENNQALYFAQLAGERQLMIGGRQRQEQQLAAERQQLQADRNRMKQEECEAEVECFVCKGRRRLYDYVGNITYRVTDKTVSDCLLNAKPPEFVTRTRVITNVECYACDGKGTLPRNIELCDYCNSSGSRGYVEAEEIMGAASLIIKTLFFPIILFFLCVLEPNPATAEGTPEWTYKNWHTVDCEYCGRKGWK